MVLLTVRPQPQNWGSFKITCTWAWWLATPTTAVARSYPTALTFSNQALDHWWGSCTSQVSPRTAIPFVSGPLCITSGYSSHPLSSLFQCTLKEQRKKRNEKGRSRRNNRKRLAPDKASSYHDATRNCCGCVRVMRNVRLLLGKCAATVSDLYRPHRPSVVRQTWNSACCSAYTKRRV